MFPPKIRIFMLLMVVFTAFLTLVAVMPNQIFTRPSIDQESMATRPKVGQFEQATYMEGTFIVKPTATEGSSWRRSPLEDGMKVDQLEHEERTRRAIQRDLAPTFDALD